MHDKVIFIYRNVQNRVRYASFRHGKSTVSINKVQTNFLGDKEFIKSSFENKRIHF